MWLREVCLIYVWNCSTLTFPDDSQSSTTLSIETGSFRNSCFLSQFIFNQDIQNETWDAMFRPKSCVQLPILPTAYSHNLSLSNFWQKKISIHTHIRFFFFCFFRRMPLGTHVQFIFFFLIKHNSNLHGLGAVPRCTLNIFRRNNVNANTWTRLKSCTTLSECIRNNIRRIAQGHEDGWMIQIASGTKCARSFSKCERVAEPPF